MTAQPALDEFRRLAASHRVVPVWREVLADLTTPVSAFARVVGDDEGFLLESVEGGDRWSRWSFMGRRPHGTLVSKDSTLRVIGDLGVDIPTDQGMLAALELLLDHYRAPEIDGLPPLHGGLIGYLGYDVVREVEHLPHVPEDDLGYPDAVISMIGELAVYDHWRQRVVLVANALISDGADDASIGAAYEDALARLDSLAADGARSIDEPLMEPADRDTDDIPEVNSTMGKDLYCRAVEAAREYIFAGDVFQVVLSQRFDLELDAEAFDLYRVLRQVNPSPYMYFFRHGDLEIVGGSPEPMVQLLEDRVISRPIAGTRKRGSTEEHDKRMAAELQEHPKEIAEHVMLVDLARNDVGRVVEFGSLQIDEMMTLERYSHVMHLTSQVSGDLRDDKSPIDVLRATLPAGTLSGAPKVRAMEIIDELEPVKRGPYGGVVGYLDFSGNIDTAIAIRTMLVSGNRASIQAGAGVVADSVPEDEHLECQNKAKALLAAVPAARRMTAARKAAAT
ncbi:MAG: anthranilate synthase component I [Acidimicrobiales bacterium]|jgi:anthranilate synthase component 1|nr:anthranilate synthase component I [Acidimicrobiales bacterium]